MPGAVTVECIRVWQETVHCTVVRVPDRKTIRGGGWSDPFETWNADLWNIRNFEDRKKEKKISYMNKNNIQFQIWRTKHEYRQKAYVGAKVFSSSIHWLMWINRYDNTKQVHYSVQKINQLHNNWLCGFLSAEGWLNVNHHTHTHTHNKKWYKESKKRETIYEEKYTMSRKLKTAEPRRGRVTLTELVTLLVVIPKSVMIGRVTFSVRFQALSLRYGRQVWQSASSYISAKTLYNYCM